jgi:hypothetical protein
MFGPAARTADPSKPTARIAAVKILLDDVLDDRSEVAVSLLEAFVFRDKPLKMMEEHPIENGPLRTSRTIDSRHSGRKASRNRPMS